MTTSNFRWRILADLQAPHWVGYEGIRSKARKHILGNNDITQIARLHVYRLHLFLTPGGMVLPVLLYTPSGGICHGQHERQDTIGNISQYSGMRRRTWMGPAQGIGGAVKLIKEEYKDVTLEPIRTFFDALFNDNFQLWAPYEVPLISPWHTGTLAVSLLSVMLLMPYHHLLDKVQPKLSKISDSSLDFSLHPVTLTTLDRYVLTSTTAWGA